MIVGLNIKELDSYTLRAWISINDWLDVLKDLATGWLNLYSNVLKKIAQALTCDKNIRSNILSDEILCEIWYMMMYVTKELYSSLDGILGFNEWTYLMMWS